MIFTGLSIARNCLRSDSGPLKYLFANYIIFKEHVKIIEKYMMKVNVTI